MTFYTKEEYEIRSRDVLRCNGKPECGWNQLFRDQLKERGLILRTQLHWGLSYPGNFPYQAPTPHPDDRFNRWPDRTFMVWDNPDVHTPLKIVCAAIKAKDGDVITGVRWLSPDMLKNLENRPDKVKFLGENGKFGFMTNAFYWVDPIEAYNLALEAGQIQTTEALGYPIRIPLADNVLY